MSTDDATRSKSKAEAFKIEAADGSVVEIPAGEYYVNTKARCRRKMLNSLSPEARRVDACLELGTMGFRQELAVLMDGGQKRGMTPTDISRQTGLSKQHVRRAFRELEDAGLAERRSDDGGPLRNGHILLYSFAVPREAKTEKGSQRAATFPDWFPDSWEPLKSLIKRLRLVLPTDEVAARGYLKEVAEAARGYQKAEMVAIEALKRVCAQPENGTHIRKKEKKESSERKHASMHALNGLRSLFPDDPIREEAIEKLHARLTAELGDYDAEAFLGQVGRRVRKASKNDPVTPGLVFSNKNGLVGDFCGWVKNLRACEAAQASQPELKDDPALARWRKDQEAALSDPTVSEQEKHLIRQCLDLNGSEPRAKAQEVGRE